MKELELYIHIPFCAQKCHYCDFVSFADKTDAFEEYVNALCREMEYYKERFAEQRIKTVYIGGGTPSLLPADLILRITDSLYKNFNLTETKEKRKGLFLQKKIRPTTEFSMECNPGTVDKSKLDAYWKAGINRISFGLQSTIEDELRTLGRIHTYEDFIRCFEDAREVGFDNINVDLMQALPGQDMISWQMTLGQVGTWHPEHISAYSLIIEEGTDFHQWMKKGKTISGEERNGIFLPNGEVKLLPSEEEERDIYYFTKEMLEKSGYKQYEISNYAVPGFECQHNIGYWKRENYLGLGLNASSMADNVRWKNTADLAAYIQDPTQAAEEEKKLSVKEQMEEFMFLGLRLRDGISQTDFVNCFHQDITLVYGEVLDDLYDQGMITYEEDNIKLTDKGIDVSNRVLAEFLIDPE
ncbi:MAG: oxygen-independent coproporphyrinogen III oxidase [Lachnospiraceae bacterium]|nr:oxygen-independent coproporphyrinogen III oxidase [Lachnospiraceae bacterium]